jgi:hypothetical protein
MKVRNVRAVALAIALGQAGCSGGCGKAESNANAEAGTGNRPSVSASLRDGGSFVGWPMSPALRRAPGVAGTLLRGAHELALTDEEKANVTKVETALMAESPGPLSTALGSFQADLLAGIRTGKMDAAKLAVDYAAIDKGAAAQQAREAEALSSLHGVLSTPERQSIVSAVRTRRALRERLKPPAMGDAGGMDWTRLRVEHLTRELGIDLDAGLDKRLVSVVAADTKENGAADSHREDARKRMDAILASFEGDAFDVAALPLAPPWLKSPHQGAERAATFDGSLVPILTPEQREKLAARVQRLGSRPGLFPEDGPVNGAGYDGVEEVGPMVPIAGPALR